MAKVEVTMPKMGESITEGTVITWHKQIGDVVELDETLLEIGTDKVDTEVPSPSAGVLKEILVGEEETVDVGTVIAILETDVNASVETAPTSDPPVEEGATAEKPEPEGVPEVVPAPAPSSGEEVNVVMPKMGESIMEGTIISWHKKPGDAIELDETLLEIATDKVDTEVPSPAAGFLKSILVPEGDTVEVNTPIAVISSNAAAASQSTAATAPATPQPTPVSQPIASSGDGAALIPVGDPGPIARQSPDGRFLSPLVRAIAEKEGLSMQELSALKGSGREGRLTKEDVLGYLKNRGQQPAQMPVKAPQPPPFSETMVAGDGSRVEIIEMDRMRQIIANHMVRSKATSAHVTSFAEADVTNLARLRERHKAAFLQREGVKLTFTPFFVQAAVEALRELPILNASVENDKILVKRDLHIAIAVAIGNTGLVAPVIRNAGQKNLVGLAHAAADLATRARNKQLQPDELQSGTFTVTNIGSLGSIMGTPIISQPQVAILATGAIKKRPVVVEDPNLGDIIAIRQIMYLSLSYDHRIIDGAMGSAFLQKYVQVLESYDPHAEL